MKVKFKYFATLISPPKIHLTNQIKQQKKKTITQHYQQMLGRKKRGKTSTMAIKIWKKKRKKSPLSMLVYLKIKDREVHVSEKVERKIDT